MKNSLRPELEASLNIITDSFRKQFENFEDRQEQRAVQANRDGKYSLTRLLQGLVDNDVKRFAPYEAERSDRIAEELGRVPRNGYAFVPLGRRDLTAAVLTAGGALVETEVAPGDVFSGYLHTSSVLSRQGISQLNLRGNGSFPRVSGKISTGWLSTEGSSLTESQFAFAVAAGTPKSVGAYCEVSNQFLRQTSQAAQAFVLRELARATAAEIDAKCLNGSGASGEPTGLLNTAGLGSVTGTTLAYAGVLDAVKNVENVSGIVQADKAGFVLAPDAARILRGRERAAGSGMIMNANDLAGYPAHTTKSTPDASLIFGDWSQMALLNWGVLEIGADPYGSNSALFKAGLLGLRAIWTCDVVILHVESFQKITSIT